MFVCGLWTLVASTNPQCLGAELFVDYNTLTFTPVQRFPLGRLKKNKFASMYVDGQVAKVVWSDKVQYEVQSEVQLSVPLYDPEFKDVITLGEVVNEKITRD